MTILFLAAFVAGVVLGVHVMLSGVEHVQSALPLRPAPDGRYPASARKPAVAGFLAVFGLVGWWTHRSADAFLPWGLVLAAALGILGAWLAALVVTRWAIPAALADEHDERFLLMGHVARVSAPIDDGDGQVTYELDGVVHRVTARALDGTTIAAGTDVVIERIEEGVAFVEPWSEVEQRI